MVNKQYNVQILNKKSKQNQSPPPNRNVTVISSIPNPQQQSYNITNNRLSTDILNSAHQQKHSSATANTHFQPQPDKEQNVFGRNITYRNDDFDLVDNCDENSKSGDSSLTRIEQHKDLSINDIGRFQYILQMDREMVSFSIFLLFSNINDSPLQL